MTRALRKKSGLLFIPLLALSFLASSSFCEEAFTLETYLSKFDYQERIRMKRDSRTLVEAIQAGKVRFIDIRFKEEYQAYRTGFAHHIPLNKVPRRPGELSKDKIIVTACPHMDREILAMAYLRTRGFQSKYPVDGPVGPAEYLRRDRAREFVN